LKEKRVLTELLLPRPQGQLMLNSKTTVTSLPDRGKKKCLFEVVCGHTGTPFEIMAADQRTKHEWMLAVKKVCMSVMFY